jgi:hypothetical protein
MDTRELRCFPPEDQAFAAAVESCIADLEREGMRVLAIGPALQRTLRFQYPGAVVIHQQPLAAARPTVERWYAYRDGHPEAHRPEDRGALSEVG